LLLSQLSRAPESRSITARSCIKAESGALEQDAVVAFIYREIAWTRPACGRHAGRRELIIMQRNG
jgi:replicative DNA helicase